MNINKILAQVCAILEKHQIPYTITANHTIQIILYKKKDTTEEQIPNLVDVNIHEITVEPESLEVIKYILQERRKKNSAVMVIGKGTSQLSTTHLMKVYRDKEVLLHTKTTENSPSKLSKSQERAMHRQRLGKGIKSSPKKR